MHTKRQVLAFDVRRANTIILGISPHGFYRCGYHPRWRISVFVLGPTLVHFNELGVINAGSNRRVDSLKVGRKAVRCDLELPRRSEVELFDKRHRVASLALAQVPGEDQLGVPLHADETVSVSPERIAVHVALLLASDIGPDFIALHIPNRQVVDHVFEEPFTVVSHDYQHVEDGVAVDARDSLNGAHRASLNEKPDDLGNLFLAFVGAVQFLRAFTIGLVALTAAEALVPLTVFPKSLAFGFAIMTGHRTCLSAKQAR